MSITIVIVDGRGERVLSADALPLAIGDGLDADIALSGDSRHDDEPLAHIGIAEGHLFVQPALDDTGLLNNDEPVGESQWISDGDRLELAGAAIHCRVSNAQWSFRVETKTAAQALEPPASPPPATQAQRAPPAAYLSRRAARSYPRWLSFALLSILALLLIGLGFVFSAVSVELQINPSPDTLTIRGVVPGVRLKGRRLMLPGRYSVTAHKAGYRSVQVQIDVEWGESQSFAMSMAKLPGLVTFAIEPDAEVVIELDGVAISPAPLEPMELEAGPHTLRVELERYLPHQQEFEVEGLGIEQQIEVELVPAWAAVSLQTSPPGATVRVGGDDVGETPLSVDLLAGGHDLELSKTGFELTSIHIEVNANEPLQVPTIALEPARAKLQLGSRPSGAAVRVDGAHLGNTPVLLELEPDIEHEVQFSKQGYKTLVRVLSLQSAQQTDLTVNLAADLGIVFITSTPADANLTVDGKKMGRANRRLELTTVPHSIDISKPGYTSFRITLTPRSGVSQSIEAVLQTTIQSVPDTLTTSEGQVLRRVEGGRFQMGASRRDQGRRANENQREVELTRAFYIGEREVTNEALRRFNSSHQAGMVEGMSLNGARQPAVMVSWEDAARYLNWLSEKDGLAPAYKSSGETMVAIRPTTTGYRLPSEAEWAFVARYARQAQPSKYPWGDIFPPGRSAHGNYADASANGILGNVIPGYDDGYPVSAPPGAFSPNAIGIFDLGGNVAEWCHDHYAVYPTHTEVERDPVGPPSGKHHVVRGSSWRHSSISALRFTYRDYSTKPRMDLGFRIARYAD